jgi:hypothetical protein
MKRIELCDHFFMGLAGLLGLSATARADLGYLIDYQPMAITQTLIQGNATTVDLTLAFNNTGVATIHYTAYVQDDPACPAALSSHAWIPLTPQQGSVPPGTQFQAVDHVPLNATGLAYGTYITNICVVSDGTPATNIAVPVTFKSVAADDIFMDGFE